MSLDQLTVRLDDDVMESLRKEAKLRGQPMAVLARIFIREALIPYDAASVQIMQNTEETNRRAELLQEGISAILHMVAEQSASSKRQKEGESIEEYSERLKATYRDGVYGAISKGKLITAALQNGQGKR